MQKTVYGKIQIITLLVGLALLIPQRGLMAWVEHPLITYPVAAAMPEIATAGPVKVESIETFLSAEAKKLEQLLAEEEKWAKKKLDWYPPLPAALAFKADGRPDTIRERFCYAIRVNPRVRFPIYLQLLPGQKVDGRASIPPSEVSFMTDTEDWNGTLFVSHNAGELVKPLDVLVSATDEPDLLGPDIGLFEDNGTDFGKAYSFGKQPFGNPNLEYGSKAPFHMGFYHESVMMYPLAGFLKKTLPEYRIHLYKRLAQFAFETGHPYWGWRFTGLGLHYLADLSQPYHATLLPGVGMTRAVGMNTIDLMGLHGSKNNAIQLVSNRHIAIEKFAQVVLRKAYLAGDIKHPILAALGSAADGEPYTDRVPRDVVSKLAHDKADETDRIVEETMPAKFVSDPTFELGTSAERAQIVERMAAEKGTQAIERQTLLIKDLLTPFAVQGRGYIKAALKNDKGKP
jgi:hypothetical protein